MARKGYAAVCVTWRRCLSKDISIFFFKKKMKEMEEGYHASVIWQSQFGKTQ